VKNETVKKETPVKQEDLSELIRRGLELRAASQRHADAKVKKEPGKKGKSSKVKREPGKRKKRASAKCKAARREQMSREVALSDEFSDLMGVQALSRPQAVSRLWAHCKDEGMLNPENKREILFSPKLEQVFGVPSARMTDLIGLLVPHFDYSRPVKAELGAKRESGAKSERSVKCEGSTKVERATKTERIAKVEPKKEKLHTAVKAESSMTKQEPDYQRGEVESVATPVKNEAGIPICKRPKLDNAASVARTVAPRLLSVGRTSVSVGFVATAEAAAFLTFEAVAAPARALAADSAVVRRPCSFRFEESPETGDLIPHAEACFQSLQPSLPYTISVEVSGDVEGVSRSSEVSLPQRAAPEQWSTQEVLVWCSTLHIPDLVRKAKEYAVDGVTLMSLGDEDLLALGLAAPFLRRRVLAALTELRSGGTHDGLETSRLSFVSARC